MKIKIEIADDSLTLAKGLMGRKTLASNEGMFFKFPTTIEARFWGKNTYIPLDIAFIRDNKIVDINRITPMSTRTIASKQPCSSAVEVNAGFFEDNQIKVGHIISVHGDEMEFKRP